MRKDGVAGSANQGTAGTDGRAAAEDESPKRGSTKTRFRNADRDHRRPTQDGQNELLSVLRATALGCR